MLQHSLISRRLYDFFYHKKPVNKITPSKVLENATVVSLTKSSLMQFHNSLQCKSSRQQLPEKVVKIELNVSIQRINKSPPPPPPFLLCLPFCNLTKFTKHILIYLMLISWWIMSLFLHCRTCCAWIYLRRSFCILLGQFLQVFHSTG